MTDNELKWYVVRAISGQEKKVKSYLEKEIVNNGLQDFVTEVLTPTEKVFQIRKMKDGKSKKIAVEKNFFPGYVIINANLTNGEVIHMIRGREPLEDDLKTILKLCLPAAARV